MAAKLNMATQEDSTVVKEKDKRNNDRGKNWSDEEVYELIEVWSDDTIQEQLEGSHRNQQVYKKISKTLAEKGYTRTWDQCRQKVKKLRKDYKDVVDNNSETGRKRKTFKYFDEMDAILGSRPATKPSITICSDKGILEEDNENDAHLSPYSGAVNPELLEDIDENVR